MGGSFRYCTDGWVIQMLCRWVGHSGTVKMGGSFRYCVDGWVIQVLCSWMGHSGTVQLGGSSIGFLALLQCFHGYPGDSCKDRAEQGGKGLSPVRASWPPDFFYDLASLL